MTHLRIKVKGLVQGVGFRPFVFKLARALNLSGSVRNTSGGVVIEVAGRHVRDFLQRLRTEHPEISCIESIETESVETEGLPGHGQEGFSIVESEDDGTATPVAPDMSICDECLSELLDPSDRRHLHPFINCTNCGPRYSITRALPYDRQNTTMAGFMTCKDCSREYGDPRDRRFHAQANACNRCGPKLGFHVLNPGFEWCDSGEPVLSAVRVLKAGGIVAVKGLGGFHLACNAEDRDAVARLRERKHRPKKPFALMAPDLETIRRYCDVTEEDTLLLLSRRRPIVLLRKRSECGLPEEVAPGNRCLGFMLPYTPIHCLLFFHPPGMPNFNCLIMTSGNLSEEPIICGNEAAVERLSGIADAFLLHDRDIYTRVDDSVVRADFLIRRSRGYAPEAIPIGGNGPEVLGVGADLKNTFTLTRGPLAIPSQHIGDMENLETLKFFEETLEKLKSLYKIEPVALAHDMHPGYHSTRWAEAHPLEGLGVQHHHAHVASVMAEAGLTADVIGVALDGSGYGTDGTIWGSEFLIAGVEGFERLCHFNGIPLPGGEAAIREPWRTAAAWIQDVAGENALHYMDRIGFLDRIGEARVREVLQVAGLGEFSPRSCGAGRLFDAVAAITGMADKNTYEAEAATALESRAADGVTEGYPFTVRPSEPMTVDFSETLTSILEDLTSGADVGVISARFHNTVVAAVVKVVGMLHRLTGIRDVVVSGGVFQSLYIRERVMGRLSEDGFSVYCNRHMPPNDANISLGQAYILRERLKR
ncbi:MAG: carbamoyltransferase HypF [Nitrospirae bacterium]|nr:carbamoyltransferase HypF [Nitrospirota bacterium]